MDDDNDNIGLLLGCGNRLERFCTVVHRGKARLARFRLPFNHRHHPGDAQQGNLNSITFKILCSIRLLAIPPCPHMRDSALAQMLQGVEQTFLPLIQRVVISQIDGIHTGGFERIQCFRRAS